MLIEHVRAAMAFSTVVPYSGQPEPKRQLRSYWRTILAEIANKHRLTEAELLGQSRQRHIAWPRQELMYRMRTETPLSYPEIGRRLGGRDHTTALHGYRAYLKRLAQPPKVRELGEGSIRRSCVVCDALFRRSPNQFRRGGGRFCSTPCANTGRTKAFRLAEALAAHA